MPSEDQNPDEFKVKDRRRFAPGTGERREEKESREESPTPRESPASGSSRPDSGSLPEITFAGFVLGLSAQALMLLGEAPDPSGEKPVQDLSAARQLIDVLGILKDKTVGNLEKDEEQLLEHVLYDLRTKFIEKNKNK